MAQIVTPLNKIIFAMQKVFQTILGERSPEGNIAARHTQTPTAHIMEISLDDLRFTILIIIGMLVSGRQTEATKAIVSIICVGLDIVPIRRAKRLIPRLLPAKTGARARRRDSVFRLQLCGFLR
jgi:hypothetical protein